MGLFYLTFICSGKFTNVETAHIEKKIKISNVDQIIENSEWNLGKVSREELLKFVRDNYKHPSIGGLWCGTCNYNSGVIKTEIGFQEDESCDLFLEEILSSSFDEYSSKPVKYILVERGFTFTSKVPSLTDIDGIVCDDEPF